MPQKDLTAQFHGGEMSAIEGKKIHIMLANTKIKGKSHLQWSQDVLKGALSLSIIPYY